MKKITNTEAIFLTIVMAREAIKRGDTSGEDFRADELFENNPEIDFSNIGLNDETIEAIYRAEF